MTTTSTTIRQAARAPLKGVSLVAAFATAAMLALASHAAAVEAVKRPQNAGLTTGQRGQTVTPLPCNTVSFCNQVIAYCAEHGGNWIETSHDGIGRPSSGTCYLD